MAEEKPKTSEETAPKPVRKVKKILTDETPVAAPAPEGSKAEPKPASKAPAKKPSPKGPAKAAAKKPAPKPAAERKAAPKVPEKKPESEKEPEAEKPAVAPKGEEKVPEKKPAKKPTKKAVKPPEKEEKKPAKKARKPTKKEKEKEEAEEAEEEEKKPAKKARKPTKKEKEEEEAEEAEEEEEHEARKKPELTEAIRAALRIRREIARRRPTFYRQEWYRYKRLGLKWRKPQGGQSKLRRHLGYRINVVSIGFRGPRPTRGLHPSGFQEVLVHTVQELKGIDPKTHAVRIGGGVGGRKRHAIQEEADELGLRILNRREE